MLTGACCVSEDHEVAMPLQALMVGSLPWLCQICSLPQGHCPGTLAPVNFLPLTCAWVLPWGAAAEGCRGREVLIPPAPSDQGAAHLSAALSFSFCSFSLGSCHSQHNLSGLRVTAEPLHPGKLHHFPGSPCILPYLYQQSSIKFSQIAQFLACQLIPVGRLIYKLTDNVTENIYLP